MHCTSEASDLEEIREEIHRQQKLIEQLTQLINEKENVHAEAVTHYVKNEVDRALENQNKIFSLRSRISNLSIKGDFRIRYENRLLDTGGSRDRFRQRFRLGFIWKADESLEIGAGFKTGEADKTGSASATSANDTYSSGSPFNNGDYFIDYAYIKHKFADVWSLTVGQQKNPYITGPVIFDSDVRPVGLTVEYNPPESLLFCKSGVYVVQTFDEQENDDANLLAFQTGLKYDGFLSSISYFYFDSASSQDVLEAGQNEVNLLVGYAEYSGKIDPFNYKFFAEYSLNLAADKDGPSQVTGVSDPERENKAFIAGAEFEVNEYSLEYSYVHVDADSYFAPLTSGSAGSVIKNSNRANNVKAHRVRLEYKFTKNSSVCMTYYFAEALKRGDGKHGELFQVDFRYKF